MDSFTKAKLIASDYSSYSTLAARTTGRIKARSSGLKPERCRGARRGERLFNLVRRLKQAPLQHVAHATHRECPTCCPLKHPGLRYARSRAKARPCPTPTHRLTKARDCCCRRNA